MSSDYNYDEQGQFFPFFIFTVSAIVTIPLTYSLLKPSDKLESNAAKIGGTTFTPQDGKVIPTLKARQRRRERRLKRAIAVIVGYATMAYMVYLIVVTQRVIPKIWDPYTILDVARSATEKQIKSRYRKLSITHHPDKVPQGSSNETIQAANDLYVEITKAYKALTDEEIRNNYLQYGHPDGKQSFSIGIALPQFIVTEGNGKYVLLFYGAMLGVLLPYLVGKWWYGTQKLTKEKVLIKSANNLFKEWSEMMSSAVCLGGLSAGEEMKDLLKGNRADVGLDQVERAVLEIEDAQKRMSVAGLGPKEQQKLQELDGVRRKALALLWAHVGRIDLKDETLTSEKYEAAAIAFRLNDAMIAICLAYGQLPPLLGSFGAGQRLIQAVPPTASPLLQLPYVTKEIAEHLEGGPDVKKHITIQQYMDTPEAQRRKLSIGPGLLTPAQYEETTAVARQIPFLKLDRVLFKCMGEKVIIPGSLVEFVVKGRFIPPGTTDIPEVTQEQLADIDPDEGDLDALLGRKPPKSQRRKDAQGNELPAEDFQPPLAHAPFFPRDHSPRWHLFLAEPRQGRIAVPPTTFTTFDRPIFTEKDGKIVPTFEVQTLKLKFQAPPQPGQYTFMVNLICDSYIGMDSRADATLVVEDASKAAQVEEDDEISEPDEDSFAGQMEALKQGGVAGAIAAPPKKSKKAAVEDDSDDSDTDEDEETSETDTETDTDGE